LTVADALAAAAARLTAAGIENASLDAELLLRHVLEWDRASVIARARSPLDFAAETALHRLVEARASRRPLQHLTGTQAFWRHDFLVTPDVLIPRPETEVLVEAALAAIKGIHAPVVVDVGTGSGCIALSLAAERPDAEVHAVDISPAALRVARENARRASLTNGVRFHEADLLAPWECAGSVFDLVASNPPYVSSEEIETLAPEVRDHEPRLALVPPGSPLSMYERLAPAARAVLRKGGALVLEVGAGQATAVSAVVRAAGFSSVKVVRDLQGIPRTIVAY
jgi:release factor glutamine methyltransferase